MKSGPSGLAGRSVRALIVGATICWGLGAVVVAVLHRATGLRVTSYLAASPAQLALGAAAGLGLIGVGAVSLSWAPRGAAGALSLLAGCIWLAPVWVGWENGPWSLRALGLLLAPLLLPVLVHLSSLDTGGRSGDAWDRRLSVAAYAVTSALALGRSLVLEPLRDASCTVACGSGGNPLLTWANQDLARMLDRLLLLATVVLAAAAVARAGSRMLSRRTRWSFGWAVTLPAAVALLGSGAHALLLLDERAERYDDAFGTAIYYLQACALVALVAGISSVTFWRLHTARRRLVSVTAAADAGALGDDLTALLARSLSDDGLEVFYRVPESERLVDAAGREARIDPDDPRTPVLVTRGRQPVATVLHHPDRLSSQDLELALGGLTRMVMDNERLRASASLHLAELQASRARIVAAGDDLRRTVERDLHDGAQQRLLAAAYELRLARAETAADGEVARRLDQSIAAASTALDELREFAHGVFPAVLDEAGLGEALFSLADGAAVPVELDVGVLGSVPPAAARASYFVVRSVVSSASAASVVEARVRREGYDLVVETSGGGPIDPVRLGDRVGAVGGEISVCGTWVRAVIPCGS